MEETPHSSKTDTGAATEAKTSTTAAVGVSSSASVAKAKPSHRELCRPTSLFSPPALSHATPDESNQISTRSSSAPTLRDRAAAAKEGGHNTNDSGAGGCHLSGTSWARPSTTRRVSRITEALSPSPLVLHTTENDASSGQGATVATTEGAAVATVESDHSRVRNLSITSTEALQPAVAVPCRTLSLHDMLASSLPTAAAAAAVTRFATHSSNRSSTVTGSGACEPCSAPRACPRERAMQHALVHVLQRERVRALITRALHLWHLHRALRQHGRRHGDRETAAGVEGRRETPSASSTTTGHAFYRSRHAGDPHLCSVQTLGSPAAPAAVLAVTARPTEAARPSASRLAWTPLGGVGIGVRYGGIATDEGTAYVDANDEEELHDVDDDAEVPRHTEPHRCQQQRRHRGRRCTDGNSSLSDADAYVDGTYNRVGNPDTSARPLAPASRSSVAPVIGAASRATSIVPSLSALSNASQSQSLARDMSFTSVRWSMSCPFQTLLQPQPQPQDELCSTSFPQTPVAASVPETRTADGAGVSLSVDAAAPPGAAAGSPGSAGATGATVTAEAAAAAAERRKRIKQHILSSKSPRNASPHQRLHNWLSSGVGGGSASSFDDSCFRPQSCSQSDREAIAAQGGPPLCLRRPRSGAGGGAGLIASDSEDRSISSLMNTPQGRQTDASSSYSSAWGPLKDGDSIRSNSTSPMPTVTATTVPQLLAREAEDRLVLQATEERRRLRLQHSMTAVMDQLMMAALHHRWSERGLHPSLRTSTAPSPVIFESDDGCGMDFLCACTTETENEGATWSSAGAIEPAASAREPRPSTSPSPVQQTATSRRTQR